uniref:K Homology domain-containing protein n=1 Tax=Fibrocapsa japonica TaxID=94617 RepID=A0A7S2XZF6_9STRA|mmetsp:Transcript_3496/g.5174  ORF Transcript_3496/g.5174 Transcript_3496/m.5174 type:complete len:232 (+) Transcript_3496:143-838(+)
MDTDGIKEQNIIPAEVIEKKVQGRKGTKPKPKCVIKPNFPAIKAKRTMGGRSEFRRIRVPAHRYTPLREQWQNIMDPVVEHMRLQIRFNPKTRSVELKTSEHTEDAGALQKAADFVQAFCMGFEVQDAVALLRLDDLYIDSFEVKDVKALSGDHLSRAIGRIAGQDGKTRHAIENATRTRVVVADQRIHILGSFANIRVARDAICNLILGAPPGKVYNQMKNVARRMNERF